MNGANLTLFNHLKLALDTCLFIGVFTHYSIAQRECV